MLADKVTITFDVVTVLLFAAIALFLIACPHKYFPKIKPWGIPLGLACLAGAFLAIHWGV